MAMMVRGLTGFGVAYVRGDVLRHPVGAYYEEEVLNYTGDVRSGGPGLLCKPHLAVFSFSLLQYGF